jgi:8-oxo-dGTP pyrophosphatase MutT (NUDIX family)
MPPQFAARIDSDWLRRRLFERPGGMLPGDAGWLPAAKPVEALKPAAVLVPLLQHEHGVTVLFTRRTDHLHDHAGQISFPGGRVEPGDDSPMTTALRETEEEIGLARTHVEIVGCLPDYRTGTGYRITPVVGLLRPPLALRLDDFEVAEAFEVPLAFLLDPSNHQRKSMMRNGRPREFYAMPYQDYYIWGATAGILMNLYSVLTA